MARDGDGRTSRAKAPRHHWPDCLRRDHALASLCGDRPLCGAAGAARQIHSHRYHGDDIFGLGLDAVAGHRISNAGVLRSRRSRSDHVVTGRPRQRILGSHRCDRAVGDRDGAVAVNALCRRSRDRRRRQMVFRLRRRDGDWIVSSGSGGVGGAWVVFRLLCAPGARRGRAAAPRHCRARCARQRALGRKEFVLLRRDPWLVSQTLMQLLYLLPPALLLWRSFADSSLAIVLITPVIVMAAGQLAGGLAWLTISGEDAVDLVATDRKSVV